MEWIEITLIVLICVIILMMVLFGFNRHRSTSQRPSKSSVSRTTTKSPTIQQELEFFAKQEKYKRLKGHVDYFKGTEFQDASKLLLDSFLTKNPSFRKIYQKQTTPNTLKVSSSTRSKRKPQQLFRKRKQDIQKLKATIYKKTSQDAMQHFLEKNPSFRKDFKPPKK